MANKHSDVSEPQCDVSNAPDDVKAAKIGQINRIL
jgi:hypothetical protein